MYLFEYHKSPRMFWLTIAALVVVVVIFWPSGPKCSDLHGQTWDYQTNMPVDCH